MPDDELVALVEQDEGFVATLKTCVREVYKTDKVYSLRLTGGIVVVLCRFLPAGHVIFEST